MGTIDNTSKKIKSSLKKNICIRNPLMHIKNYVYIYIYRPIHLERINELNLI